LTDDYEGTILRLLDGIGIPTPDGFGVEAPRMKLSDSCIGFIIGRGVCGSVAG
jgi:hypothetical protein